jgi:hypothetical protein
MCACKSLHPFAPVCLPACLSAYQPACLLRVCYTPCFPAYTHPNDPSLTGPFPSPSLLPPSLSPPLPHPQANADAGAAQSGFLNIQRSYGGRAALRNFPGATAAVAVGNAAAGGVAIAYSEGGKAMIGDYDQVRRDAWLCHGW